MRKALDRLYAGGLLAAALSMSAIATLVLAQVAGRVLDRALALFGAAPLGFAIPSIAEFGGFLFVASAFLALPATLRAGNHVRVTILAQTLPRGPLARAIEVLVMLAAVALAGFATWHSGLQALDSWQFGTVSYGMVRVPLWLPQAAMTVGLGLFLVSLLDELAATLAGRLPGFRLAELDRDRTASGPGD